MGPCLSTLAMLSCRNLWFKLQRFSQPSLEPGIDYKLYTNLHDSPRFCVRSVAKLSVLYPLHPSVVAAICGPQTCPIHHRRSTTATSSRDTG